MSKRTTRTMLVPPLAAALAIGLLGLAPTAQPASAAEAVGSLELIKPHALDDRQAEDGTPIAVDIDGRIIGARLSTTPAVVDLTQPAKGTRYFVDCQAADGGTGTAQGSPLNTLDAASSLTLTPGDEVLLKRGTECDGALTLTGSGTEGNRIVVNAYGDASADRPLINGNGAVDAVRVYDGQHWEIRNLEVTNQTNDDGDYATKRRGIVVSLTAFGRGQDYVVTDNYVHHVWGEGKKDLGGSGGIQFESLGGPDKIPTAFDGVEIAYNTVKNVNRSGINVGTDFRQRGTNIGGQPYYAWGPLHIHDNLVSNVGGDGIVNQFAQGSLIENNSVWDTANHHGGKSNNGNNAAVWAWDSDYTTFRQNHVFNTAMVNVPGSWDGAAFDADYATAGSLFEYNLSHDNAGGFMMFCGCGGLSTDTVVRYNISLNDGKGGEDHVRGSRLFFHAGGTDAEVYNNTFLLYNNVQLNSRGTSNTAVAFANNVFLAQGPVRNDWNPSKSKAEVWRTNVFGGAYSWWPNTKTDNMLVPGLTLKDGTGIERLKVDSQSIIATGRAIFPAIDDALPYFDAPDKQARDMVQQPVPVNTKPDAGAFQLTSFNEAADVPVFDGGFENDTTGWTLAKGAAITTTGVRNGDNALALNEGTATQLLEPALNRTYRLTAAVKGDVSVSVMMPRREGDPQPAIVAEASQRGEETGEFTPVSTIFRTASVVDQLTLSASGTGTVDDVALTQVGDYVVDGSFESPTNSPWGRERTESDFVAGQYAGSMSKVATLENDWVVVPAPSDYELWGWAMSPTTPVTVGVENTGTENATTSIVGENFTQGMTTFSTKENLDPALQNNMFTVFCSTDEEGVEGAACDDITVTTTWDKTAPAVGATPERQTPQAPADPEDPVDPALQYIPFEDITVVGASSESSPGSSANVNNGDINSIWHSKWSDPVAPPPHWITLAGPAKHELTALAYTPRQDNSFNGVAKKYTIRGSDDPTNFDDAAQLASGEMARTLSTKTIEFKNPTSLRYVRLNIDSHYGEEPADKFGTAAIIRLKGYPVDPMATVTPQGDGWASKPGGKIVIEVSGMRPGIATLSMDKDGETFDLGDLAVSEDGKGSQTVSVPLDATDGVWTVEASQLGNAASGLKELKASGTFVAVAGSATPTATATATTTATATSTVTATTTATPGPVDVYSTPGYHVVNGRFWFTSCEPYSQTKRCRTNIWATTVTQSSGRFVKQNGWVFNNLTYLPSKRSLWQGNPLGHTNEWVSAGRRWRTECDTEKTGRNGCRSFIWAQTIHATTSGSSYTYAWKWDWQFNNIVRYT